MAASCHLSFGYPSPYFFLQPLQITHWSFLLRHERVRARTVLRCLWWCIHPSCYLSFTPNRINCVTGSGTGNGYRQPWPKCKFQLDYSRQYPLVRISNCVCVRACVRARVCVLLTGISFRFLRCSNCNNNDKKYRILNSFSFSPTYSSPCLSSKIA